MEPLDPRPQQRPAADGAAFTDDTFVATAGASPSLSPVPPQQEHLATTADAATRPASSAPARPRHLHPSPVVGSGGGAAPTAAGSLASASSRPRSLPPVPPPKEEQPPRDSRPSSAPGAGLGGERHQARSNERPASAPPAGPRRDHPSPVVGSGLIADGSPPPLLGKNLQPTQPEHLATTAAYAAAAAPAARASAPGAPGVCRLSIADVYDRLEASDFGVNTSLFDRFFTRPTEAHRAPLCAACGHALDEHPAPLVGGPGAPAHARAHAAVAAAAVAAAIYVEASTQPAGLEVSPATSPAQRFASEADPTGVAGAQHEAGRRGALADAKAKARATVSARIDFERRNYAPLEQLAAASAASAAPSAPPPAAPSTKLVAAAARAGQQRRAPITSRNAHGVRTKQPPPAWR